MVTLVTEIIQRISLHEIWIKLYACLSIVRCPSKARFNSQTPSCLNEEYRTVCTSRCLQSSCYHPMTSCSPAKIQLWLTLIPPPLARNFELSGIPPRAPLIVECIYYSLDLIQAIPSYTSHTKPLHLSFGHLSN